MNEKHDKQRQSLLGEDLIAIENLMNQLNFTLKQLVHVDLF